MELNKTIKESRNTNMTYKAQKTPLGHSPERKTLQYCSVHKVTSDDYGKSETEEDML